MTAHLYILTSLFLIFFLLSCEGPTGPEGPIGPEGPFLTGDLYGSVILIDQYGASLLNHSGVTVQLEGTDFSATTDSSAKWMISGLSTGTYTLSFSKSGYGTSKSVGYQFVGGGQTNCGEIKLAPIPDFNVSLNTLEAEMWGTDIILLSGGMSLFPAQNAQRELKLFIGFDDSVSAEPDNYVIAARGLAAGSKNTFSSSYIDLTKAGLKNSSGLTLWVVTYSSSGGFYYDSGYVDLETGKYVYTNLGSPSEVLSFVVP